MKKLLFLLLLSVIVSCQRDYKVVSLELSEQWQVIGDHYNADMTLCLDEAVGSSGFSFTMYIETKDGRSFECSKDVHVSALGDLKSDDKCIDFTTRPFFNVRGADEDDFANMKSMTKGNIQSIRIVIWDDSFDNIIEEKTFRNL